MEFAAGLQVLGLGFGMGRGCFGVWVEGEQRNAHLFHQLRGVRDTGILVPGPVVKDIPRTI